MRIFTKPLWKQGIGSTTVHYVAGDATAHWDVSYTTTARTVTSNSTCTSFLEIIPLRRSCAAAQSARGSISLGCDVTTHSLEAEVVQAYRPRFRSAIASLSLTSMIIISPPPPSISVLLSVVWCGMWQWINHFPGRRAVQITS